MHCSHGGPLSSAGSTYLHEPNEPTYFLGLRQPSAAEAEHFFFYFGCIACSILGNG